MIAAALSIIRPKHWVKNLVVFAPLIFAKELFEPHQLLTATRAFVAFCLTASSVYVINDMADVEWDRAHPEKRNRPLASGAMSMPAAVGLLVVLLAVAALVVIGMETRFLLFLGLYFLLNLAYSYKLKDVLLLDVFIIAAGFMLRVLGGAYAIGVLVSSWIVLCSMFISLFLGFAKRRGELMWSAHVQGPEQNAPSGGTRRVLKVYRVDFLDQMLTIAAAGAVIAYALYTVAPRTVEMFGTDKLIYTTVFVIYGVFRYIYIVHTTGRSENPTNALTSDLPILFNGALWILFCVYLIYFHSKIFR
jgi:4-hydroxybenzoate polyprenyltransferase